jgi:hypothetical protein
MAKEKIKGIKEALSLILLRYSLKETLCKCELKSVRLPSSSMYVSFKFMPGSHLLPSYCYSMNVVSYLNVYINLNIGY